MATAGKKDFRLVTDEDLESMTLTVRYLNKEGGEAARRVYDPKELDKGLAAKAETGKRLVLYGLAKVLQDRTSDLVPEVKTQGPEVRLQGMDAVFSTLLTEGWNARRGGGGTASVKKATLYEAIARVKGITSAQAAEAYRALDDEAKKRIEANESVQAEIAKIQQESEGNVSLDDLA